MRIRGLAFGAVALLVGGACATSGEGSDAEPVEIEQRGSSPSDVTRSALEDPDAEGLPEPLVDTSELRSGGPPPDGIPPIDDPQFLRAGDVDFLADDEPVLAIELDGDARAYPIQIMTWHEIVNDTIAGVPVTISYCPLCNSAIAYDRRLDGEILDFGTSGLLYRSALVMYDRQTESLWSHFSGEAVAGQLTGTSLETLPVSTVSWSDWREADPDGLVLGRDTGHDRPYGQNPYPGYDDIDNPPFAFDGEVDDRFEAKERVVGIGDEEAATAVPLGALAEERVLETTLGGRSLVVFHEAGTASALDSSDIDQGRDVGATGVFEPLADGRRLTFEPVEGGFRDRETGSTWNILGQATGGPLAGSRLPPVVHVDTFWFAWSTFLPDTEVGGTRIGGMEQRCRRLPTR